VIRRLISITVMAIALPVAIVTAPIWILLAAAADIVGRLWRFPTIRLGLFALVYLTHQWAGVGWAGWLAVQERLGGRSRLLEHRETQTWWAASQLRAARKLLGVNFDIDDLNTLPDRPFLLVSRHASMVDAVLPIVLIAGHLQRYAHYILKDELLWDPAINIYGTRLGNRFVGRGTRTDADLQGIAQLADNAEPNSVMVIFPEGTYATPTSRKKVLGSLARKVESGKLDAETVKYASNLKHLLPPKPAGTLKLLSQQPDADVVVLGHVGLEGVAELKGLRRRLPLTNPVVLRWWTFPRAELPHDVEKLEMWLRNRWVELDDWVATTLSNQTDATGRTF
jgi:1-acyl-sn-glycerol-3-phosphate acyltransferase